MVGLTVAVLAGGKSSRMGTDKSFVEVQGVPIIEHLIRRITGFGQRETFLVTNRPHSYEHLGLRIVQDVLPGKGSLGGIYTALYHSETRYTLVLACDMPFVSQPLLSYMIELSEAMSHDVIVPRVEGYPQGLHAIYGKTCLAPILARLETNQNRVIGFYDEVNVRYIDELEYRRFDPNGLSFSNVNTPEDLQRAKKLAIEQVNEDKRGGRMPGVEQDKASELPGAQPISYHVVEDGTVQKTGTGVIDEALLTIYVNGQELATMMCSPIEPEALALGFLFNEGIIAARDEVKVIHANVAGSAVDILLNRIEFEPPRRIILTSGCGGVTLQELTESYPPLATAYTISPDVILNRMRDLQATTKLHDAVGGVHAAGFGDAERLLVSTEDIGRHNAVDRLAGLALQSGIPLGDGMILSSGRISSEMIGKVRRMEVPVVASLTSPTSISVRLAQAWNICLVGYVRRGLMRVYAHPERLGLTG